MFIKQLNSILCNINITWNEALIYTYIQFIYMTFNAFNLILHPPICFSTSSNFSSRISFLRLFEDGTLTYSDCNWSYYYNIYIIVNFLQLKNYYNYNILLKNQSNIIYLS